MRGNSTRSGPAGARCAGSEREMICAADIHIRKTRPRARKDDFFGAMGRKLRFILELAKKSPPLVIAGDFFELAKPGEELLAWVIGLLNGYGVKPVVIPGQHDLPGHSLHRLYESGVGVLAEAGAIDLLVPPADDSVYWHGLAIYGCPYGREPIAPDNGGEPKILLWHHMVIQQPLWPGQKADKGHLILKKYPQFDIIVTGDNHQSFAVASQPPGNRWLINPGSMMRTRSDQIDHRPCVYEWNDGVVKQHFLPVEEDVWDLEEIEQEKGKEARHNAFVERLDTTAEVGVLFEDNLEAHLEANQVRQPVRDRVWGWAEENK